MRVSELKAWLKSVEDEFDGSDPEIGIEWPEVVGEYKNSGSAEGYALSDGTKLNLSNKDQEWTGLKDTFKF